MPELNLVDTSASAAEGRIRSPYYSVRSGGYEFTGTTGFMEFGQGTPGSLPFRVDQAGNLVAASISTGVPGAATPGLALQAATPLAGYTLVNGTGTVITWTTPNDGAMHRVAVFAMEEMASNGTGGLVNLDFTDPGGTTHAFAVFAAGAASGGHASGLVTTLLVAPGTVAKVSQDSALSGGAGTVWAEIWGS